MLHKTTLLTVCFSSPVWLSMLLRRCRHSAQLATGVKHFRRCFQLSSAPIRPQMHCMGQGWALPAMVCSFNTSAGYFEGMTPLQIARPTSANSCSANETLQ